MMKKILKQNKRLIAFAAGVATVFLTMLLVVLIQSYLGTGFEKELTDGPIDDPSSEFWEAERGLFAEDEELVLVATTTDTTNEEALPVKKVLFEYIRIVDSCGVHFAGTCVNVRSGPGTDFPVVTKLRNDIVLKVDGKVEHDGHSWFRIVFDEWLRYPERAQGDWYVSGDYVEVLLDEGVRTTWDHGNATTTKRILVDRSEQMLYAYEGDELFMQTPISTGLELSPTPRGTFTIFKKTPSRYMQGPIPELAGSDYYDLPGVPWNLYFTEGGAVVHGAYWHDSFGSRYSHGCVNLPPDEAERLYNWAPLGTQITVQD